MSILAILFNALISVRTMLRNKPRLPLFSYVASLYHWLSSLLGGNSNGHNKENITEGENSDLDRNHRDWCGMPEELLVDILLRLPVLSLIRLKSVCKSWCGVTGSSMFIAQHLDCNRGKDSLIAIDYSSHCYDGSCKICLLSGKKYEVCHDMEYGLEWTGHGEVDIGNCCDGIMCIVNKKRGIIELWNPALKQKRRLPGSLTSPSPLVLREYNWMCGFGYDAQSKDYKVVKICRHAEKWGMHKSIAEVYSLRGDSWKIIHDGLPVPDLVDHRMPWQTLSGNGKCYWIGCDDKCHEFVVCFDLNDERFETMALPGSTESTLQFSPYHVLDFLDGKLVCIKGKGNLWPYEAIWPTHYEIWVLEHGEDGATKSWSKLRDFGPTSYRCGDERVPLAFSKDGRFLLLSDVIAWGQKIYKIYLCDLGAAEDGDIELEETNLLLLAFDHYTESLVSLKGV